MPGPPNSLQMRMNSNLVYVTSFNEMMYRETGIRLVSSFCETETEGGLLLCPERCEPEVPLQQRNRVKCQSLDNSLLLHNWLESNADIIPVSLGGAAQPCRCAEPDNPASIHVKGCVYGWFNKNSSRWFRKIVALKEALARTDARYLIWLDSDCYFVRRVDMDTAIRWFDDCAVFIHKSPQREVIESGVIGFDLATGGLDLIDSTLDRYLSGDFRRDDRWDDGYQFQATLEANHEISVNDIATIAAGPLKDVVRRGLAGSYIAHEKGIHRFRQIMQ